MKYVKKQLIVSKDSISHSACLYWLTGRRLFSKWKPKKKRNDEEEDKTDKKAVFLGIFPKFLRGVYPIEENLDRLEDAEFVADVRFHDEWIWSSCIRKLKAG